MKEAKTYKSKKKTSDAQAAVDAKGQGSTKTTPKKKSKSEIEAENQALAVDGGESSDDDNHSGDGNDMNHPMLGELHDKLAILGDKKQRTATKVSALEGIHRILISSPLHDFMEKIVDPISDECMQVFKKGTTEEKALASNILGVMCLLLDDEDKQRVYKQFETFLEKSLLEKEGDHEMRSAYATNLAFMCFLSISQATIIKDLLEKLVDIAIDPSTHFDLAESALGGIGWLFAGLDVNYVEVVGVDILDKVTPLLKSADHIELRIAAARLCCLVIEVCKDQDKSDFDSVNAKRIESVRDICEAFTSHANLDKTKSKKDRKKQSVELRELIDFLMSGDVASEILKFGEEEVLVDTLAMQAYVDALKQLLGSGLQAHVMINPYARALVGLREEPAPSSHNYHWIGGNSKKKKKTSEAAKKKRDQKRDLERSNK